MIRVRQAPVITRNNLPDKKVNHNYSQSVIVAGGTDPITWSIISGNLPVGLALDSSTGVVSGVPTVVGVYNFAVQVSDANSATDTKSYSIEINP